MNQNDLLAILNAQQRALIAIERQLLGLSETLTGERLKEFHKHFNTAMDELSTVQDYLAKYR